MSRRVCKRCLFSVPSSNQPYGEDRDDEVVECRRLPPPGVHVVANKIISDAPKVSAWFWCFEWSPQEPTRIGRESYEAPERPQKNLIGR